MVGVLGLPLPVLATVLDDCHGTTETIDACCADGVSAPADTAESVDADDHCPAGCCTQDCDCAYCGCCASSPVALSAEARPVVPASGRCGAVLHAPEHRDVLCGESLFRPPRS